MRRSELLAPLPTSRSAGEIEIVCDNSVLYLPIVVVTTVNRCCVDGCCVDGHGWIGVHANSRSDVNPYMGGDDVDMRVNRVPGNGVTIHGAVGMVMGVANRVTSHMTSGMVPMSRLGR